MRIDINNLPFDPMQMPEEMDELVFLCGSWKDMGRQYGSRLKSLIARSITESCTAGPRAGISNEVLRKAAYSGTEKLMSDHPYIYDLLTGICEGTGYDIEDAALATVFSVGPLMPECSTLSAWGSATSGRQHLAGVNGDGNWGSKSYYPSVVAFPENSKCFFTLRGLFTNCMMNADGLVAMTSAGQTARKEDVRPNMPSMTTALSVMALCRDAKEAESLYVSGKIAPGLGENFHCSDRNEYSFVIEHTAGHEIIRRSGDHGEKDYLIANNHYLDDSMQASLFSWPGCDTRYWTVEKIFGDNLGKIDLPVFLQALSSNRYYKDGEWSCDFWDLGPTDCTPENNNLIHKTHSRALLDMDALICYRQNCGSNRANNLCPKTTGNFSRIKLLETPLAITDDAEQHAMRCIWDASKKTDRDGLREIDTDVLDKAKASYIAGLQYRQLALYTQGDDSTALMSRACSAFLKAQRLALCVTGKTGIPDDGQEG